MAIGDGYINSPMANTPDADAAEHDGEREDLPPYADPAVLDRLYNKEGLSMREIGERFGKSRWSIRDYIHEHGLSKRNPDPMRRPVPLVRVRRESIFGPYLRWDDSRSGESVYVSQLVAIAEGHDPHDIFSKETSIHFENGRRDDLRPENIAVDYYDDYPWRSRDSLIEGLESVPTVTALSEKWDVSTETLRKYMRRFDIELVKEAGEHNWQPVVMDEEMKADDEALEA